MSLVNASDYIRIPLTQNQYAIIDKKNEQRVNAYIWHAKKKRNEFYAYSLINGKHIQMANFLMNHDTKEIKSFQVDHINRNPLDHREQNMRKISPSQNMINRNRHSNNTSGITGICHSKKTYMV